MAIQSEVQALRQVPLFSELDESFLEPLGRELTEARFHPGQHVFEEGDPSSSLYVIRSGKVKVSRRSAGKER